MNEKNKIKTRIINLPDPSEALIQEILNRLKKIEVWIHNMSEISKSREFPGYEPNIIRVIGEKNDK